MPSGKRVTVRYGGLLTATEQMELLQAKRAALIELERQAEADKHAGTKRKRTNNADDIKECTRWTVAWLQQALKERNLSVKGSKAELAARLLAHYNLQHTREYRTLQQFRMAGESLR